MFKIEAEVMEVQAALPTQVVDWGVNLVQAPQMWSLTKGEGMKVAILDTGVDRNHPDLKDNIKMGMNFTTADASDFQDRNGHGTHCAGIIAGIDNGIGVVGVAPKAELYIAKVLGDNGSGGFESIIRGIDWAIAQKVDIISMSLGASGDPGNAFHDAFKRARAAGIIIVAASGNENTKVGYPACYEECIAVGAIDQSLERAKFSNFGKELDVVAPGVDIYSTYPVNSYAKLSGTSMATPIVSGVVALIQSFSRRVGIKASPDVIIRMLEERTVDLGTAGQDQLFGTGLTNVYKAIKNYNQYLR